jgi:hypothetical protein
MEPKRFVDQGSEAETEEPQSYGDRFRAYWDHLLPREKIARGVGAAALTGLALLAAGTVVKNTLDARYEARIEALAGQESYPVSVRPSEWYRQESERLGTTIRPTIQGEDMSWFTPFLRGVIHPEMDLSDKVRWDIFKELNPELENVKGRDMYNLPIKVPDGYTLGL